MGRVEDCGRRKLRSVRKKNRKQRGGSETAGRVEAGMLELKLQAAEVTDSCDNNH